MRARRVLAFLFVIFVGFGLIPRQGTTQPPHGANHTGQGVIIELDNDFITSYANKATISSEHTILGISSVHPAKNDGEVHVGGWVHAAGLPGVVEVMNAASSGKSAMKVLKKAASDGQPATVKGAWRIWAEHAGTGAQIQARNSSAPAELPGEYPSNPDHVFEIHPVTSVKVGNTLTDATDSIGVTPGFTPYDAQTAFLLGYEKLPCKIVALNGRTRIITHAAKYNFADFIIRLGEDPVKLDDGHGVICSVYDTDGELVVRNRRMVFMEGTDADDQVKTLKKGKRLKVTGIPRLSFKLLEWRLKHKNDKIEGTDTPKYDVSPLDWHLPYEMIIVAAAPLEGNDD